MSNVEVRQDNVLIEQIVSIVRKAVENSTLLSSEWLKNKGYTVVPVESACHFDEDDAENIANAMTAIGYSGCLATPTEKLDNIPPLIEVHASQAGLMEFSRQYGHYNMCLTTQDEAFLILCTVNDYFLVAGAKVFIEKAVGCTIEEAFERFYETAEDDWWKGRLKAVYDLYASSKT